MIEDNNVFYVRFLGEINVTYKGKTISEKTTRSKKIWNLLAYIIMHKNRVLLQSDIMDSIWPDDASTNPVSALKTSLFRIRGLLEEVAVDNEEFILSSRGAYRWNSDIECKVDAIEFEELCLKSEDKTLTDDERIVILEEAINMYYGDFLKRFANDLWVIPLITHYHSLYVDKIKILLGLLDDKQRYSDMQKHALNAIRIESYDEKIHSYVVKAFMKLDNNTAAIAHYNKASKILLANLGVQPSNELRSLYLEILNKQKSLETNLDKIIDDLKEAEYQKGAFICDYGIFKETYKIVTRQAARFHRTVSIVLITVCESNGELPALNILDKVMERLGNVIKHDLRRGDVVSKYSGAQFVIMLPDAQHKDAIMITNRIIKSYYHHNRKSLLQLKYNISEIKFDEDSK
ncbi:MAG: diguanylate cyclase [Lachnospiraceae bacterium]|nr:diguanylate cyclase [Lachnospiraceae bacterium]